MLVTECLHRTGNGEGGYRAARIRKVLTTDAESLHTFTERAYSVVVHLYSLCV